MNYPDFKAAIVSALRNYKNFTGRANRGEYWYFTGAVFAGSVLLDAILRSSMAAHLIEVVWVAVTAMPSIAVLIRRMRDADIPYSRLFLFLLPVALQLLTTIPDLAELSFIGTLLGLVTEVVIIGFFIYWLCQPSKPETKSAFSAQIQL